MVCMCVELRESLSLLSSQFELGKIADANEALDYILHKIHEELRPPCPESQKCLSHEVFGGAALEQAVCRGAYCSCIEIHT